MATMTAEEREAINGADPDEIASLAAVGAEKDPVHNTPAGAAAEDGPEDDEKDEGDDDEGDEGSMPDVEAAAPAAAASEPAAAEPVAEVAPAASAAVEPVAVAPASFQYELPTDFEDRKAAIRTANSAALEKYDAGELTKEELLTEQERIADERRQLDAMQTKAEIAQQMQQQSAEAVRMSAVNRLFEDAAKPEGGAVDYRTDAAKMRDLDTFVKALAADEANASKPLGWFLDEAHRRVKVLHNIGAPTAAAPAAPAKTPAQVKAEAVAARKPDLAGSTPDLSQVPGGSDSSDVGGEFQDIDNLDGMEFEAALAKMAKTQPERFARYSAGVK
jgi:hypothetical protein